MIREKVSDSSSTTTTYTLESAVSHLQPVKVELLVELSPQLATRSENVIRPVKWETKPMTTCTANVSQVAPKSQGFARIMIL